MIKMNTLDEARVAIRQVAEARRASLTAMSDAAGIARGVITRFASSMGQRQIDNPDIRLSSVLRFLDYAGYEMVFRPKDTRSTRQRLRDAARGGADDAA